MQCLVQQFNNALTPLTVPLNAKTDEERNDNAVHISCLPSRMLPNNTARGAASLFSFASESFASDTITKLHGEL